MSKEINDGNKPSKNLRENLKYLRLNRIEKIWEEEARKAAAENISHVQSQE